MFGNVRLVFGTILENLRKSSESGRKSSEDHQKRRFKYVYKIQRTLHVSSKIWILCYSWQEQYLIRSLRSLVRYCSCHSNIKFVSSRHRVISSIYSEKFLATHSLQFKTDIYVICRLGGPYSEKLWPRSWKCCGLGQHFQDRGHSFSLYGPT